MKKNTLKVVLVEDNPDLREELCFQLSSDDINITAVADAVSLDNYLSHSSCDIVVLDIGLPGESGLSIAGRLRQSNPELGIIMLTAHDALESRLNGFEQGADVYLVKPVHWREISAQILALQRRIILPSPKEASSYWQLKETGRELVSPYGNSVKCTSMEGQILTILAQNSGNTVSRQQIIDVLDPEKGYDFDPRRIEVCISRLRQKMIDLVLNSIENNSSSIKMQDTPLKTVRGVGYIFTQPIQIESFS